MQLCIHNIINGQINIERHNTTKQYREQAKKQNNPNTIINNHSRNTKHNHYMCI